MLSLIQGINMDQIGSSNLGPTLGSNPESLDFLQENEEIDAAAAQNKKCNTKNKIHT